MFQPSAPAPETDPPPRASDPCAEESPDSPPAAQFQADGGSRRLDPRHVPCARLGGAVLTVLLLAGGTVGFAFLAFGTDVRRVHLIWIACVAVLALALVGLSAWFYPPLEYRHCAWRLSPFGLEIRRGVWFRHSLSVPRARVQHADVERGPIERRFDLATLVVHTAGHQHSEIRLEGLEHGTALAIRDYLLARKEGDA